MEEKLPKVNITILILSTPNKLFFVRTITILLL